MQSSFYSDLSKEEVLGDYMDKEYIKLSEKHRLIFERNVDLENQKKGIDLILKYKSKNYYIDEKAQLDYLNKDLPTFAFEISYLMNGSWRLGWLYDSNKITDQYFLITNIRTKEKDDIFSGIEKVKLISVSREKLIRLLDERDLGYNKLIQIERSIRSNKEYGKHIIKELNTLNEGNIHYTKTKNEKPINLVLKLDFLIKNGVGKKIIS